MPINKNALQRYLILDKCLRNPYKKYTITDLVDICNNALLELNPNSNGISKRTIYNDLSFLQSSIGYNAEILKIKEGKFVFYRYMDTTFSITNAFLSVDQAVEFQLAIDTLDRFQNLPQFEWISKFRYRLQSEFYVTKNTRRIIYFDDNDFLEGRNWISVLYKYIQNRQVLNILYQPYGLEARKYILHPYILKEYNNRWFLFGLNSDYSALTNLALDRIKAISPINLDYKDSDIEWDDYFYDIVGVSFPKDQQLETVVVLVRNNILPLIKSKPIHGSQKIYHSKGQWSKVVFKLFVNNEFYRCILSFGSDIVIVSPESLIEKIIFNSRQIIQEYESCEDRFHM